MSHFLKRMLTQQGIQHLFFYTFQSYAGLHYHVSVCRKNELAAVYKLRNRTGSWQLEDPCHCPDWLVAMEAALNEAIAEHQAE